MVYNEHKLLLHTLRLEDSWPFKEGRCSYQKVGHKTLLTNTVGCWGPNKHQLGLLVKTWFGLFPWIESHKIEWTSTPPTMTWHVGLIKSIYFTQNKRHWLFSFPSKLSEAKREEAEVQKTMEELKRKATLEEWGIFDKNVALPNLSETKHLRGLFSFETRPNSFMWLVTGQFALASSCQKDIHLRNLMPKRCKRIRTVQNRKTIWMHLDYTIFL